MEVGGGGGGPGRHQQCLTRAGSEERAGTAGRPPAPAGAQQLSRPTLMRGEWDLWSWVPTNRHQLENLCTFFYNHLCFGTYFLVGKFTFMFPENPFHKSSSLLREGIYQFSHQGELVPVKINGCQRGITGITGITGEAGTRAAPAGFHHSNWMLRMPAAVC